MIKFLCSSWTILLIKKFDIKFDNVSDWIFGLKFLVLKRWRVHLHKLDGLLIELSNLKKKYWIRYGV